LAQSEAKPALLDLEMKREVIFTKSEADGRAEERLRQMWGNGKTKD